MKRIRRQELWNNQDFWYQTYSMKIKASSTTSISKRRSSSMVGGGPMEDDIENKKNHEKYVYEVIKSQVL